MKDRHTLYRFAFEKKRNCLWILCCTVYDGTYLQYEYVESSTLSPVLNSKNAKEDVKEWQTIIKKKWNKKRLHGYWYFSATNREQRQQHTQ